tara:strand:+ start:7469 stop:7621 length:153 start_codon:yes stop_codon:yes gene_type:complete
MMSKKEFNTLLETYSSDYLRKIINSKVYSKKHRDKCKQILESRYGFKKYN